MAKKKKQSDNSALNAFRTERPKHYIRNRVLASIIDFVIVALLCQLLFLVAKVPDWVSYLNMQEMVRGLPATDPLVVERMKIYQECFIQTLLTGMVYEALMLVLFGGSAGKLVFGMRVVVSSKNDRPLAVKKLLLVLRAFLKSFSLYLLSAIPFVFMCLTTLGNPERKSGFDMFAGTRVITQADE